MDGCNIQLFIIRGNKLSSKIKIKIWENQDRREREQLIKELPFSITSKIDPDNFIYSYQLNEKLRVLPGQNFTDSRFINSAGFKSYVYQDLDDINDVKEYLIKNVVSFKPPLYCWFGSGPIFIINDKFNIKLITDIEKLSNFSIYIIEINGHKGFIFDQYLGYLCEERMTNNNEVVFEIVNFS